MAIPIALASFERATTQPSLLERTTAGRPINFGAKTRSHDTKKLLQSTTPIIVGWRVRIDDVNV